MRVLLPLAGYAALSYDVPGKLLKRVIRDDYEVCTLYSHTISYVQYVVHKQNFSIQAGATSSCRVLKSPPSICTVAVLHGVFAWPAALQIQLLPLIIDWLHQQSMNPASALYEIVDTR